MQGCYNYTMQIKIFLIQDYSNYNAVQIAVNNFCETADVHNIFVTEYILAVVYKKNAEYGGVK